MKTKEELNALREEVEALNKKLAELTAEEFEYIAGGDANGGHLSGKLRMNYIRIIDGDGETGEPSPSELSKGRITWRNK